MRILIFSILLLSSLFSSFGQQKLDTTNENLWNHLKYDLGSIFGGMCYVYSRPLHWQGGQWLTFGGVSVGTGALYLFDDESSEFFRNQKDDIPKFVLDYGYKIGSPENNYMITGAVYLTGLFTKNEKLRRTGVLLISSASAAGLLQQFIKSAIGRARPVSGKSKDTFDPFNRDRNFHSFPSGHTMLAFTNVYAIAKQFKSPWIKGGIYTIGLVPGVSRLWEGEHWFTDVALGVAISIFTVEAIDKYLDKRYDEKYNSGKKKVSWNLNFALGQVGVALNF
jgi:membrane-associated phospholipid phosphatase